MIYYQALINNSSMSKISNKWIELGTIAINKASICTIIPMENKIAGE